MMMDEDLFMSDEILTNLIEKDGISAIGTYLDNLKIPKIDDFPEGLEWFNVSESLSFRKHLDKKLILLDFFTYCCINCMHILPDLQELEDEFSIEDGLVVVGVHSAKFENEKLSSNISSAVQRYSINHPVVNDRSCEMWQRLNIQCWPTLLLINPRRQPVLLLMGEGHKNRLKVYIKAMLNYYKQEISKHSLPMQASHHLLPVLKGPLLFPGKITAFGDLLAISDSGNHRILLVKDGKVYNQIGACYKGYKNGNFNTAMFNSPQGLAFLDNGTLFIADTENHAVRKVDLQNSNVTTVVDSKNGISSPWDVAIYKINNVKSVLLIAVAGTHQIWAVFLDGAEWKGKHYEANSVICMAGSGKEENRNNNYPQNAGFAQPSGLAVGQRSNTLYIADSESSTIRKMCLLDGKVSGVVGGDKNPLNLFAFGDVDGISTAAKLQHPLGVALSGDESELYIADTYNHKLKVVNVTSNAVRTLRDGFNEPGGLCISNDVIYIADTNNHHIIRITNNLHAEKLHLSMSTRTSVEITDPVRKILYNKALCINKQGGKITFKVNFVCYDEVKINEEAPHSWRVKPSHELWSCKPYSGSNPKNIDFAVNVHPEEEGFIDIMVQVVTCLKDMCYPRECVIRQPVNFNEESGMDLQQEISLALTENGVELISSPEQEIE